MLFPCLFYPSPHSQQGCAGAPALVVSVQSPDPSQVSYQRACLPNTHFHYTFPIGSSGLFLIYSALFRQKYTCLSQHVNTVIGV